MRNPYIRAKMVEALVAFLPPEVGGFLKKRAAMIVWHRPCCEDTTRSVSIRSSIRHGLEAWL